MDFKTVSIEFPPYVSAYQNRTHTVYIAGGGGTSNTGVKNQLQAYSVEDNNELKFIKSLQIADSIMWIHLDKYNNRIFFFVGNQFKSADLSLTSAGVVNHFDFQNILHKNEFITTAVSKNSHCSSLVIGTNDGRLYHLGDSKQRCRLLRKESSSIECLVARTYEKFILSHGANIDEFEWPSANEFNDKSVRLFASDEKGKVKRVISLADDENAAVVFLFNNELKSTHGSACKLRDYGSALSICPHSQIILVGMLNGFISLHDHNTLQQINILETVVNSPVTSLTCINDHIVGVQLVATLLNDQILIGSIEYFQKHRGNNFVIHISLMIAIVILHMIFVVFYKMDISFIGKIVHF
ncbi:hypothetical protein GJ496_005253 [Pomphorhynchus laevis]|nr:hypothetical protein GJ496_005253 [Pomphorhynchus laevis]